MLLLLLLLLLILTTCLSNDIWAPKSPAFFEKGEWKVTGKVRYTTLSGEADMHREAEYLRAKDLFYKFTSRDKFANYELERVVVLQNNVIGACKSAATCGGGCCC